MDPFTYLKREGITIPPNSPQVNTAPASWWDRPIAPGLPAVDDYGRPIPGSEGTTSATMSPRQAGEMGLTGAGLIASPEILGGVGLATGANALLGGASAALASKTPWAAIPGAIGGAVLSPATGAALRWASTSPAVNKLLTSGVSHAISEGIPATIAHLAGAPIWGDAAAAYGELMSRLNVPNLAHPFDQIGHWAANNLLQPAMRLGGNAVTAVAPTVPGAAAGSANLVQANQPTP